jgi:hypothetical protein
MRVAAWHDRVPDLATAVAFVDPTHPQNGHRQQAQHPRVFLLELVTPRLTPAAARFQLRRHQVTAPLSIDAVHPHPRPGQDSRNPRAVISAIRPTGD